MDLLVLVHSSELTEADLEGRTLHGQGGNGLYLLRVGDATDEPIASLSGRELKMQRLAGHPQGPGTL